MQRVEIYIFKKKVPWEDYLSFKLKLTKEKKHCEVNTCIKRDGFRRDIEVRPHHCSYDDSTNASFTTGMSYTPCD